MAQCKACGAVLPANGSVCACGQQAAPSTRFGLAVVSFLGLFIVSLVGIGGNGDVPRSIPDYLRSSLGTLALLAAAGGLTYVFRRELALGLQALETLPPLKPWWYLQGKIPKPLRFMAGLAAPFLLAYYLTDVLCVMLNNYGFLVFMSLIPINVVVASLLLAEPGGKRP